MLWSHSGPYVNFLSRKPNQLFEAPFIYLFV